MAAVAVPEASLTPSFDEQTISQLVADLKLENSNEGCILFTIRPA